MSVRANALPEALYERNPCRTPHPVISRPATVIKMLLEDVCRTPPSRHIPPTSRRIPHPSRHIPLHITSYPITHHVIPA